mgnify:CR=1 FL=1
MKTLHMLTGLAALILAVPTFAQETYPSRPIRLVVPYAPGGATVVRSHDVDLDDLALSEAKRVGRSGLEVDTSGVGAGRVLGGLRHGDGPRGDQGLAGGELGQGGWLTR